MTNYLPKNRGTTSNLDDYMLTTPKSQIIGTTDVLNKMNLGVNKINYKYNTLQLDAVTDLFSKINKNCLLPDLSKYDEPVLKDVKLQFKGSRRKF